MKSSNSKDQNSNKRLASQRYIRFDLEERMANFGIEIITLCKSIPENVITRPLISQIVRSATSIGANYSEANNSSSRRDFRNKVFIAKKEAQETKHWLKMLQAAEPELAERIDILSRENHELSLILQTIINNTKENI